jgi:hypothetical protein
MAAERDTLRRERDVAREDSGAAKATLATTQTTLAELRGKIEALEKENARLTAQNVSDQRLISQMNTLVASLKNAPPPPQRPQGQPAGHPGAADPGGEPSASGTSETAPVEEDAPRAESDAAFTQPQIDALNGLLKTHRGSDRYFVTRAEKVSGGRLVNVAMEVRGADGTLAKTIEAEKLGCFLSTRGDLLELEFEGGTVMFHQGVGGRPVRSPFFNNRYQIVVLGVNGPAWLQTGFGFVRTR